MGDRLQEIRERFELLSTVDTDTNFFLDAFLRPAVSDIRWLLEMVEAYERILGGTLEEATAPPTGTPAAYVTMQQLIEGYERGDFNVIGEGTRLIDEGPND